MAYIKKDELATIPTTYTDKKGTHIIPGLWDITRKRCSECNGKTEIVSVSFLAGSGLYDGSTPECLSMLPPIDGTCNTNCPGCYAKAMTRYPVVFLKFYLNTIEMRNDPERFISLIEKEIFSGNPLTSPRVIRLHDSGDIDNIDYCKAVMGLIERHPETRIGTYTKRNDIIDEYGIENLPGNLSLNCSPWKNICMPIGNLPQFIYDDGTQPELDKLPHCPAITKDGKKTGITCKQCLHCYTAKPGDKWAVYAHDGRAAAQRYKDIDTGEIYTEVDLHDFYKRIKAEMKADGIREKLPPFPVWLQWKLTETIELYES